MGRTTAVPEWSEEDGGFVVELEATELIAALHGEADAVEAATAPRPDDEPDARPHDEPDAPSLPAGLQRAI